MTRFALCMLALALFADCSHSRCPPGHIPNDMLQGCVAPPECDGGTLNDSGGCMATQATTADDGGTAGQKDGGHRIERDDASTAGSAGGIAGINGGGRGGAGTGGTGGPQGSSRCGDGTLDPDETCDGNCPTVCTAPKNACMKATLVGAAADCTAECQITTTTTCAGGDGCCPTGCTHATDSDCSEKCGDGVVDSSETCDGNCPTMCPAGAGCTHQVLMGSALNCTAMCMPMMITMAADGDMCCPSGASANTDSDCKPKCGNGVVEGNEKCDGNCPTSCSGGSGCMQQVLVGSADQCTAVCMATTITSPRDSDGCCPDGANANTDNDCKPVCGNGTVEGSEKCDGNCPTSCSASSNSCTTSTLSGSAARCNAECIEKTAGTPKWYFQDCDGDGYPAQSTGMQACSEPPASGGCAWTDRAPTASTTDCDDRNASRHPGADFGLPISSQGQQLPPAGDQAYDLDCDGVLEKGSASTLSTGQIKQGKLELIELCASTSSCSPGSPACAISFPVPGGGATCGEAYTTQPICGGGDIHVYFLCR